ncbi:MAG: hypothetical protein AAF891_02785 [Pseudomonadota bacterium]
MPRYKTRFDLTRDDIDVIEAALLASKAQLMSSTNETLDPAAPEVAKARQISDLLGRLHNQKIFYRPKSGAYISG